MLVRCCTHYDAADKGEDVERQHPKEDHGDNDRDEHKVFGPLQASVPPLPGHYLLGRRGRHYGYRLKRGRSACNQ